MLSVTAMLWAEGFIVFGRLLPVATLVVGFLLSLLIFSDGGGK